MPNIIAVAASDQNDALAYFSNYGSVSVDVASPGENIYSTIPARKCVWLDNFDDGNMSGWTTSGINNKWGLTTKSSVSGNYSLADSSDGNYANSTDSYAVTPNISLSGEKGTALKFNMKWNLEADEDKISVGINEVGVDTTVWLGHLTGSSGDYYELGADVSGWDGKNISVVFRMYSDESSTYDGVYIDDVEITSYSSSYSGTEYGYKDGTSMAAPFVSGLAGLIRSASPFLTNSQIKQAILNKVDVLPGLQKKVLTGGRINAHGAVSTSVVPKRLLSMTVAQADTTDVFFGTSNNPILVLDLLVDGCFGQLDLNSIQVDSQNTLDSDIAASGAKIWRSQSSVFDTGAAIQIGSGRNSNDSIWHDINYDLPSGHTYIFVTYSVSSQSILGNFIDASIPANGVNIGGFMYNAGVGDPTGSRRISFEIDMPFVDDVAPVPNIISLSPSSARIEVASCLAYDNTPPIYYQIERQFFDGSSWVTGGGVSTYDFSTTRAVPWIDDGLLTNGLYRYRQVLKDSASQVHYDTCSWSEMATLVDDPADSDIFITNVTRNGLKVGINSFLPVPSGYGATGIYFDMVKGGDQDSGWVADMAVNYINLYPNTQYGWKVKYRNYKGVETGYNSGEKKVYTLALPPSDLAAVDIRKDSVLLEWVGNGASRFQMERATDSSGIYTILDGGITSTSYRDTCLTVDNTYWYRVSGFNGDGVITEAAKILRVDVVNNQVPSVSLSGAPDNGHGPLLVSFTANAQDSDGYIVSYKHITIQVYIR